LPIAWLWCFADAVADTVKPRASTTTAADLRNRLCASIQFTPLFADRRAGELGFAPDS
jgi:hypothetical protein